MHRGEWYDENILCGNKCITVSNDDQLDAYILDYGFDGQKYKNLKIKYDVSREHIEIHSPSKITVVKDYTLWANTICLDGRNGVVIKENVLVNADEVTLLSEHGKITLNAAEINASISINSGWPDNLLNDSLKSTKNGFVRIETKLTLDQKNIEIKISDSRGFIVDELYDLFIQPTYPKSSDDVENNFSLIMSKSIITEHAGDFEIMKSDSGLIISMKLPLFEKIWFSSLCLLLIVLV